MTKIVAPDAESGKDEKIRGIVITNKSVVPSGCPPSMNNNKKYMKKKKKKSPAPKQERKDHRKLDLRFLNPWKEIGLILIITLTLYLFTFDAKLDLNGDNVDYYLLGKAISQGEGYTAIWYPGSPPFSHRPIGYPVIIAISMTAGLSGFIAIKWLNFLFLCGSLILFYRISEKITQNKILALVMTLIIGLNIHILQFAFIMMSEIPFLFFLILAVYFLVKLEEYDGFSLKNYNLWLMVVSLSVAYHIKSLGIALAFAFMVYFISQKKWKQGLFTLLGFIILALPYYLRNRILGVGSSYLASITYKNPYQRELGKMEFFDYFERIFSNIVRYISIEIPRSVVPFLPETEATITSWIIGIAISGLIIWALFRFKKYRALLLSLFVGTFGILLLWPEVWFGVRFIMPLIPFILLLGVYGIYQVLLQYNLNPKIMYSVIAVIFLLNFNAYSDFNKKSKTGYPRAYTNYFSLAAWANKNSNPEDIFIARKPQFFYLFSNRQVNKYKYTPDDKELLKDLERRNAKYVVIEQLGYGSTARYLVPAVQKNISRFQIVKQIKNPDTYLLKFQIPNTK
jgi:hypothetical protein